jgi:hypothetical protein
MTENGVVDVDPGTSHVTRRDFFRISSLAAGGPRAGTPSDDRESRPA